MKLQNETYKIQNGIKSIPEIRNANMIIGKVGGNASKNAYNCKVSIPKVWADKLGISPADKSLFLEFDGTQIIIKKNFEGIQS